MKSKGGRGSLWRRLAAVLTGLMLLPFFAAAEEYTENQWNFVDGEMDISAGIPADAEGVLADIAASGKLRVGTDPYYPPQEFIDPSLAGQERYVGADMELARLIAQRMGVELEIVELDFSDILSNLGEGKCDLVISALAYLPSRASQATLSKGYFYTMNTSGTGMLIRTEDAELIVTVADLSRRDIAAQRGSLQENQVAEYVQSYRQFMRLPDLQDVFDAVAEGTADAGAVDTEAAAAYIQNNPDCALTMARGIRFTLDEQFDGDRVAAKKGETQLIYFVNGVISEVLEGGLYLQWYADAAAYAARLGL